MNGEEITREEKRTRVLEHGTGIAYIACPLCGWNRVLNRIDKGRIRFGNFDLINGFFVQIRYGGGRGSGFFLNQNESRTISDVINGEEYRDFTSSDKGTV